MLVENVYLMIQLDDLLCKHVNVKLTRKLNMLHKVKMTRTNKGQKRHKFGQQKNTTLSI